MAQMKDFTNVISGLVKAIIVALAGAMLFVQIASMIGPVPKNVAHVRCSDEGNILIVSEKGITFQLLDGKDKPVPCPQIPERK